nr:Eco57I restriction-modification methylase domain-containing protein [Rothia sp. ZJ932]
MWCPLEQGSCIHRDRLCDPGAGSGVLMTALTQRIFKEIPNAEIWVTAIEKDTELLPVLEDAAHELRAIGVKTTVVSADFIEWALEQKSNAFDLIVQNPPYKKLHSKSFHDTLLTDAGIKVPNLYAAFVRLSLDLLNPGGQVVAITPRSWTNGTYYKQFRKDLRDGFSLEHLYLFDSRSEVFGDMGVLQESMITVIAGHQQSQNIKVSIARSSSGSAETVEYPVAAIIDNDFIFIPSGAASSDTAQWMKQATHTLKDLGVSVSTGKVVGFRLKEYLLDSPTLFSVPLLYPANIVNNEVIHPRATVKKSQWFDAPVDVQEKHA